MIVPGMQVIYKNSAGVRCVALVTDSNAPGTVLSLCVFQRNGTTLAVTGATRDDRTGGAQANSTWTVLRPGERGP